MTQTTEITQWMRFKDLKEARLGENFESKDLKSVCKAIYGGVAWPGKRPGFAVVLAMNNFKHFDSHDICLLDEFESSDIQDIVRQCGVLDYKYKPDTWIGDRLNDAADRFIREKNREMKLPEDSQHQRGNFGLSSTPILDMNQPYQYILSKLRTLLDPDRRQLFLKDSKILCYLGEIESSEILTLEFGDYPAIESLGLAAIEMRSSACNRGVSIEQIRAWHEKYKY